MQNFQTWFQTKLKVTHYPLPGEIMKSDFNYIINVSDEYISYNHDTCIKSNIKYFWFPLNECSSNMGLNSIYAALQILFIAEQEDAKVLLHCHAGANRSPLVRDCYYFLRTGNQRVREVKVKEEKEFSKWIGCEWNESEAKKNLLIMNSEAGHLPPLDKMEKFLTLCVETFQKEETMRGGGLDGCLYKSEII